MEPIFVQKIFKLTEQLLRGDLNPANSLPELQAHLKKSRELKMRLYEAEVLNTLAIAYYLQEDLTTAHTSWSQMLPIAQELEHDDLLTKAYNNLAELMHRLYEYEAALHYSQAGLTIIQTRYPNTLVGLYLHNTHVTALLMLGRVAEAESTAAAFWEAVNQTKLQQYSRFEYAQVIIMMHHNGCQLALVSRDGARFQHHRQLLGELAAQANLADFSATSALYVLLHTLLIAEDPALAQEQEAQLRTLQAGTLPLSQLALLFNLLWHTQHHTAAKRYAEQILTAPAVPAALQQHVHILLKGELT
jgi:hypothetical protein